MGWLITLAVLFLLGAIPLGVSLHYDADGAVVRIIASFFRYTLLPAQKKPRKEKPKKEQPPAEEQKKEADKPAAAKKEETPAAPAEKQGGQLTDFLPLLWIGLDLLNSLRRKLRVNHLVVLLVLGGDDPCDLALNYTRIWTAIGNLMPRLERFLHIQKRDIDVGCDFTSEETRITLHMEITITIARLLYLAAVYGFLAVKSYLQIRKKRKGGALV